MLLSDETSIITGGRRSAGRVVRRPARAGPGVMVYGRAYGRDTEESADEVARHIDEG
jgi:hypothetical protein